MKRLIEKDKKRRKLVQKYSLKRTVLKAASQNRELLPSSFLYEIRIRLESLPKDSNAVRVKNRCIFTGRSRGVYPYFRISRLILREFAGKGLIPGLRKSSW